MKVIIVYDSVSANKNTEKVAQAIGDILGEKENFEVKCSSVKDITPSVLKEYDCVLMGSPTMFWKATGKVMSFLTSVRREDIAGKPAVSFDTQYEGRFTGNAANKIEKKLKKLGFKIITSFLVTYVEGKGSDVHLKQGEIEKAKEFAEGIAQILGSC